MTDAPEHVLRWRGLDVARWSVCAVMVVAIHAGAAAYFVMHDPGLPPAGLPDIVPMEMPEIAAPASNTAEATPGPEQEKVEDQPEKLAEKPDDEEAMPEEVAKQVEPEPEVPPAPLAPPPEVSVAQQEPEPPKKEVVKPVEKKPELPKRPEPKKKRVEKPRPRTAPTPSLQVARTQSAPTTATASIPSSAMPDWNRTILAMMQRSLRFPSDAERRGIKGRASVRISVSSGGSVTSASLVGSAGDSQLDQEAVAVARRASPFPPPPGGAVTRVVPIVFR